MGALDIETLADVRRLSRALTDVAAESRGMILADSDVLVRMEHFDTVPVKGRFASRFLEQGNLDRGSQPNRTFRL